MRRRQPVLAAAPTVGDVPDCLRAGPCVEVWAAGVTGSGFDAPWWVARRAYIAAVELWRQAHGIGWAEHARMPRVLKFGARPWSYAELAAQPERLVQHLRSHDLPPDWRPRPAPSEWRVDPRKRSTISHGGSSWRDERTWTDD